MPTPSLQVFDATHLHTLQTEESVRIVAYVEEQLHYVFSLHDASQHQPPGTSNHEC